MNQWDDQRIEQCLRELHIRERIPISPRKEAIRARLIGPRTRVGVLETGLGWIGLAFSESGLRALELPRESRIQVMEQLQRRYPGCEQMASVPEPFSLALREYAQGKRALFEFAVDLPENRPFQRAVLEAIRDIPYGETRSYGWVARAIGQPRATRAVGQALNKNPIPIIIPCHRVISSDGGLGGYAGGLVMKQRLISLERASL